MQMLKYECSDDGDDSIRSDDHSELDDVEVVEMLDGVDLDQDHVSVLESGYSSQSGRKWSGVPPVSSKTRGANVFSGNVFSENKARSFGPFFDL